MTDKKQAPEKTLKAPSMKDVADWANEKGVSFAERVGLKHQEGWKAGKVVSEKEFDSALKAFRGASVKGGVSRAARR